jgi:hypothetical protein
LQNIYVCCVKIWNGECDWLMDAWDNMKKWLMWNARMKQWVLEKSKEAERFEKKLCVLCEILRSQMGLVKGMHLIIR